MSSTKPEVPWRPYQLVAIEELWDDPYHGLFHDPGLGKTATILEAFRQMQVGCDSDRLLVIAPINVSRLVWPAEIQKWRDFDRLTWQVFSGKNSVLGDADVTMVHPEALPTFFGYKQRGDRPGAKSTWIPGAWEDWDFKPDMLYVDESHRFKKASGLRASILNVFCDHFGRRSIGTGSCATKGMEGLHGQLKILDRGAALGKFMTQYHKKWFYSVPGHNGQYENWELNPGAEKEIIEAIRPRVHTLVAEDHVDLPEVMYVDREVILPPKARKEYDRVQEHALLEVGDGDIKIFNDEGKGAKLRQIAGGNVYVEEMMGGRTREYVTLHTEKLKALEDLLAEIAKPTIVVYEFNHDRDMLAKKFKAPYIGQGSADEDRAMVQLWNAGQLPVLLTYPQEGLNLQDGGCHLVWYTPTWNLLHYEQMNGRIVRPGQPSSTVLIYHLIARSTIEKRVCAVLAGHEATQDRVKEALKQELR